MVLFYLCKEIEVSSYQLSKCSSNFLCHWVKQAQPAELMLLTSTVLMECLISDYFALFIAAFMLGSSNMHAVTGVRSYK